MKKQYTSFSYKEYRANFYTLSGLKCSLDKHKDLLNQVLLDFETLEKLCNEPMIALAIQQHFISKALEERIKMLETDIRELELEVG